MIEAPCAAGKTRSVFEAAQETDAPITYLTSRHELYHDAQRRCEKRGLRSRILRDPYHCCPTFRGENGEASRTEVIEAYEAGVSARLIHKIRDLPCQPDCPYLGGWEFDPSDYDVLIGHYRHAHTEVAIDERVVVIDEYPGDAFVWEFQNPGGTNQ